MPPHAHQARTQSQQHTEHHDQRDLKRLEKEQPFEAARRPAPEEQIAYPAEHYGQGATEETLDGALEKEWAADEPVTRSNQPHDSDFLGALKHVAAKQKVALPADTTVTGKVGIGAIPTGFGIEAELTIKAPGVPRETLQALVDAAHIVCPYSNATRGNIDVSLVVAD